MKLQLIMMLSLLCAAAVAQPRSLKAVRIDTPPVIDGFGNDDVWRQAETGSEFVQREPVEGARESERTEFKILYDNNNIYVYAMMYDRRPDSIVSRLARRDDIPESDWLGIGFDSYHDKQTAFIFVVLPSGSKTDELMFNDGRDEDDSWDPVWEVQTAMLPDGWSAEMKIPLSQLRFTEGNDVWGMNVARKISRRQEETHWNLMSKKQDGYVSLFGTMTGMADVRLPAAMEVLPYVVGSSEHYPQTGERQKVEALRPNGGVDLKYGVSSNFTLNATINPDFAQVEADPEVLNLTLFETFYPEKRPFFIEGTQILRFVTFGGDFGPGLFYSRRIGKPTGGFLPPDGEIITEEPRRATILGAAKFSGKTNGGTSIGVLTGFTDEERFSYRDTLGTIRSLRAEPNGSFNLMRVKQDFWGNSNIGAIVTGTSRDGSDPAYTAGTDWDVKFDNSNYRVNGFLAVSHGTKYIDRFHRIRTTQSMQQGSAGKMNVARVSGAWTYGAGYDFTSRKYYINDLGFFRSPNDYGISIYGGHRDYSPGDIFRTVTVSSNIHLRWNYDRMTLFRELSANAFGQFLNYWSISGGASYSFGGDDPYEPRGYGVAIIPSSFFIRGEIESDNRSMIVVNAEQNYRSYDNGGMVSNTEASVVVRPTSSVDVRLSAGYGVERDLDRFAGTVVDSVITFAAVQPAALFGKRDVDGVDVTLRSSILFTHDLSLQIYNQFFWAKGTVDTASYALLNPGRGFTPYRYGVQRDFNQVSLQTNVVLRWEYREGSTFFFVWSHGRFFEQNRGYHSNISENIDNIFNGSAPNNTYVVKVSYWQSL